MSFIMQLIGTNIVRKTINLNETAHKTSVK